MISLLAATLKWCYRSAGKLLLATLLIWAALYVRSVLAARHALPEKIETYKTLVAEVQSELDKYTQDLERLKRHSLEEIGVQKTRIERDLNSERSKEAFFPSSTEDWRRIAQVKVLENELEYLEILDGSTRDLAAFRADHEEAYNKLKAQFAPGEAVDCHPEPSFFDFTEKQKLVTQLCKADFEAARRYREAKQSLLARQAKNMQIQLDKVLGRSKTELEELRAKTESFLGRQIKGLKDAFVLALKGFAALLVLPLLFRALFYFVVAPAASRRPPVCLLPETSGAFGGPEGAATFATDAASASSVSVTVSVSPTDELLIHPEYLQSSASRARMDTRWLLSIRYPLTSIASGLMALTRIRTASTESFVVSATGQDALTEIGVLTIPVGAAVVLQPRCLIGVVQRRERPMRITSHWRITSLSAWLTLQLRYLVFHGPATVIIRGCRGIRIEPAARGRLINQSATLGFSANLQYSPTRAEPFFPYLTGRHALFNDRFSGNEGFYIYEETTGHGRASNPVSRQFEGLSDAILKIFGI